MIKSRRKKKKKKIRRIRKKNDKNEYKYNKIIQMCLSSSSQCNYVESIKSKLTHNNSRK